MNSRPILVSLFVLGLAGGAHAADGLTRVASPHDARTTLDRFENIVKQKGLTVFARLDHAAGAAKVGQTLRATELLIFGNPQGGTPLMRCAQTAGIDLPLKALVWQDEAGMTWIGYNDPAYLASRHQAGDCGPVVQNLTKALAAFAAAATAK